MPEKITVAPGVQKDAENVEVVRSNEPWSTFELADGSTVKAKLVISDFWRIVGEYDAEGNPVYFIKLAPLINTHSPEPLRNKERAH